MVRKKPTWLSRNVLSLSAVSFMQDAASELLYPIMPVLLTTVLGAPAAIVGVIEGLAEATAATVKLISHRLNQLMTRKTLIGIGYGAAALGKLIIALAGSWPVVLLGRVTDRIGKGSRSAPRDALLVEGTDAQYRGRIIGFHRMADTSGAVLGPILALLLLAVFNNDIKSVLWFALIPAVLSVLLVFLVRDNGIAMLPKKETREYIDGQKLSPKLNRVITVVAVFSLVNFPDALLLLHVSQIGLDVSSVVGAYLLYNLSYAILNFPVGVLADRFSPRIIFAIGLVCFAIAYGGLGLTDDHFLTYALLVIYGGYAACNDTVGKSWVAKLTPAHQQVKAQSLLQGLSGYAVLIAGLWAGVFWTVGSATGVLSLLIAGSVAALSAILLFATKI